MIYGSHRYVHFVRRHIRGSHGAQRDPSVRALLLSALYFVDATHGVLGSEIRVRVRPQTNNSTLEPTRLLVFACS